MSLLLIFTQVWRDLPGDQIYPTAAPPQTEHSPATVHQSNNSVVLAGGGAQVCRCGGGIRAGLQRGLGGAGAGCTLPTAKFAAFEF